MKVFRFKPTQPLPILFARVQGPRRRLPIKLVFDTGAFMTQISTGIIEELGYSARDGLKQISSYGPSGPIDQGYSIPLKNLEVLGKKLPDLVVAAYDFSNLEGAGIDGLLGFDVIKQLHLEMIGPSGELRVY